MVFGLFRKKSSTKSSSPIHVAETRAAREYHSTADARMAELQKLKKQIENLVHQPSSQQNYNKIMELSSSAGDIVRAMNRITTEAEQIPFRNVSKQIRDIINAY